MFVCARTRCSLVGFFICFFGGGGWGGGFDAGKSARQGLHLQPKHRDAARVAQKRQKTEVLLTSLSDALFLMIVTRRLIRRRDGSDRSDPV